MVHVCVGTITVLVGIADTDGMEEKDQSGSGPLPMQA